MKSDPQTTNFQDEAIRLVRSLGVRFTDADTAVEEIRNALAVAYEKGFVDGESENV